MNPQPIKISDQETRPAGPEVPPNIYARMVSILGELDAIGKNARNQAQGFNYRGIDDVYNAINPLLAKHGVFMTAQIMGKTREERTNAKGTVLAFTCLHMRYHFHGEDGSSLATEAEGEGMDSGDKSSNKAMAVAHKYALLQAFCIPTKDLDDPDKDSHEVAAKQTQADAIHNSPTMHQDEDIAVGVSNWCNEQRTFLANCADISDIQEWKELRADALDRLKRKALPAWSGLMQYVEARIGNINLAQKP